MRLERSLWIAFLVPTLVPELGAGVTLGEALAIVSNLSAGAMLALNYTRAAKLPTAMWLMVSYLALSLVGLLHDPIEYFSAYFAGGLAFTIAFAVGSCAPNRLHGSIVKWLFLLLIVGALLDIALDLNGYSVAPQRPLPGWQEGARGRTTSQSNNGVYLATLMAFMVVATTEMKWRLLGACALLVVFYHVVVFGQGRGSTSMALVGMMIVFLREVRSMPALLLVFGPFLAALLGGFFDEAMAPFLRRTEIESLSEVDRLHHAQVGEMLVRSMSADEVLFGVDYRKILVANDGLGIHNAFFDTATRFGLIAAVPWFVFNGISLFNAGTVLLRRRIEREQVVAAAVVVQMFGILVASSIFVNWRSCLVPGICTGLVLRAFQAEDRVWSHS